MGEDLADKVDDFICAWDKVVGTDIDTLVVLILGENHSNIMLCCHVVILMFLGWLGFGGVIFTVSHLVYSTLGPGDSSSMSPPPSIPPYKGDSSPSVTKKPAMTPASTLEVAAQIPAQPPPTSEFGVVGSDPGAVQFISLCLQYLRSHEAWAREIVNLWLHNLNEFTIKSAVEDGMLVEFAEIEDRDKLVPSVTNMTVETMPNDNLVTYVHDSFHALMFFTTVWRRGHSQCHILHEDQQTCQG